MKTIAMYLPQFHRVKENDEWWGEGFTEWTAVRQASPLFKGHSQPKRPLNDNYYNLLENNTLYWQAELAQKYEIDGFCFYHYYFENGKKILEKPVEIFEQRKNINIKYCLCWANETWARSWNKLGQYNAWADKFEKQNDSRQSSVLLQQNYGRENEWKNHFYYLLPFFKDKRYIRNKKGEIIFLIYRPKDIYCLVDMTELWKKLAQKEGIGGICFIGLNIHEKLAGIDEILINGPSRYISNSSRTVRNGVNTYNYCEVWEKALSESKIPGIKTYFGAFQNFDDTPRRGEKGSALIGATPKKFEQFFRELVNKNYTNGNEFTFINAWNEWGEGMYLEPDMENGYEYLEAIKNVMNEKRCKIDVKENDSIHHKSLYEEKYYRYYQLLNKWMHIRDEKRDVSSYFYNHKLEHIAIYGVGGMGQHLISELCESNIKVEYVIDMDKSIRFLKMKCKGIDDDLEEVDAIIITPTVYYDEIREKLRKKVKCPIISLEEVIEESLY